MNKRRLLQIADDVMRAKPERFNMGLWTTTNCDKPGPSCEYAACAIGTHIIAHPRVRLKLDRCGPKLGNKFGYGAVMAYCGILLEEATYLFSPSWYHYAVTRRTVAARIRRFVKTGGYREATP